MSHPADRILAAVETALAGVAGSSGVYRMPIFLLDPEDLDCVTVDEISLDVDEELAGKVVYARNELRFTVRAVVKASRSALAGPLGIIHRGVEAALLDTVAARTLGGTLVEGLQSPGADFFADAKSLDIPVAGWAIRFSCRFHTRSDRPGLFDKELS